MRIIRGISSIKRLKRPVVALGVFDGVHRGHRIILTAAVKKARAIGGTSVVFTFWPHPQGKDSLYSLEHRLRIIAELGIDACIIVKFNSRFARMAARDFIGNVLAGTLAAAAVFVGDNYRFGYGARGTVETLRKYARQSGFLVRGFKTVVAGGMPVSSSFIRTLIRDGNIDAARRLLSRPVSVMGTVVKGGGWAGGMGFPTANLDPHHEVIPPAGIYAVHVLGSDKPMRGICYIGTDPTLKLHRPLHVEVHIFDFKKDIYGKDFEIQFLKKIRGEQTFPTTEALITQIKKDIARARAYFSR